MHAVHCQQEGPGRGRQRSAGSGWHCAAAQTACKHLCCCATSTHVNNDSTGLPANARYLCIGACPAANQNVTTLPCLYMWSHHAMVVISKKVWQYLSKLQSGNSSLAGCFSSTSHVQVRAEACGTGMHISQFSAASPEGDQPGYGRGGGQTSWGGGHSAGVQGCHRRGGPDCTISAPLAAGDPPSSSHLTQTVAAKKQLLCLPAVHSVHADIQIPVMLHCAVSALGCRFSCCIPSCYDLVFMFCHFSCCVALHSLSLSGAPIGGLMDRVCVQGTSVS